MGAECWLAQFTNEPCEGQLQRAHLVREQKIRREATRTFGKRRLTKRAREAELEVIWDSAVWRWACAHHHFLFDTYDLPVPIWRLPPDTVGWLAFYEMTLDGDRRYAKLIDT